MTVHICLSLATAGDLHRLLDQLVGDGIEILEAMDPHTTEAYVMSSLIDDVTAMHDEVHKELSILEATHTISLPTCWLR